jgi:hypothetical protein
MALNLLMRRNHADDEDVLERRIEPRLGSELRAPASAVFDSGGKTIIDCAHVKVERLDTRPVLFSKVFKEFEDRKGQKYDYRYWAERENFFLREFLKKQHQFTHVVQARHLISENEAAKQVLTCDAGITVANWLRVKARYADTTTLSHPFQRSDAFLRLIRACLVALKQLHQHRIVHCDIKEDNICIAYAPNPFPGAGRKIHIEFDKLKLIDFAFSVAHAIPLTQILVINPDERVPYQSELLIAALHADRRSGLPNAVQQLDYRVDLFSLGYMAEKISAAGLDCPPGTGDGSALEGIRKLVQKLKAYDTEPEAGPLPHDSLIAEIDRLLLETAGPAGRSETQEFNVDGEWSVEEMASGQGAVRKTPSTPVALPPPTPVSPPLAHALLPSRVSKRTRIGLLVGLALGAAAGAVIFYGASVEREAAPASASAESKQAGAAQSSSSKPTALPLAESSAVQDGEALVSAGTREARAQAFGRLVTLAAAGDKTAAQRIAAFEKNYDDVKQAVAKSAWWARGGGAQPDAAARWLESGMLLAQYGDRPAMLDIAFAMGHGRALKRDRAASVQTYLSVVERTSGADESSARIRQAALRGLGSLLNTIAAQQDDEAARRVLPLLQPRADSGAADLQYYSGLLSECALQPADLEAARKWYARAAADNGWRRAAEDKARLLGRWCPRPST